MVSIKEKNYSKDIDVSVVIPTYNRLKTLPDCINSVLKQSFQNYEIIISDDCSSDKTEEFIKKLQKVDNRIKYYKASKNNGAQAARNLGIENANGKWIAFLDSDDEWPSNRLELAMEIAFDNPNSVILNDGYIFDKETNIKKRMGVTPINEKIIKRLLRSPGPFLHGLIVPKKHLISIGMLDEKIPAFQEWDTSIRLALKYDFAVLDKPLYIWNKYNGDTITNNSPLNTKGYMKNVEKHKEKIIDICGFDTLQKHYKFLGYMFLNSGDKKLSRKYFKKAIQISQSLSGKIYLSLVLICILLGFKFNVKNDSIQVYGVPK